MVMLRTVMHPVRAPRARSFAGLMDLYESNYMRLRKLIPALGDINGQAVSRANGALNLHMELIERCKYTTTIALTYRFDEGGGRKSVPDLRIRVYHDAQLAEVLTCRRRKGCATDQTDCTDETLSLARRWESNRFLQKWLGFCLHQGHHFGAAEDDLVSDWVWVPK